jgi:NAD(P)H-flavin reductase
MGAAGSGSLFGLSSNTLLIAGGIGLAALLIAKRKG